MTAAGIGPISCCRSAVTCEVLEAYAERVLGPTLRPEQIPVMDNLTAQKGDRAKESIEHRGCQLLYLSPYSSDLKSIQETLVKVERILRRVEVRRGEALVEAMGASALDGADTQCKAQDSLRTL